MQYHLFSTRGRHSLATANLGMQKKEEKKTFWKKKYTTIPRTLSSLTYTHTHNHLHRWFAPFSVALVSVLERLLGWIRRRCRLIESLRHRLSTKRLHAWVCDWRKEMGKYCEIHHHEYFLFQYQCVASLPWICIKDPVYWWSPRQSRDTVERKKRKFL